MKKITYTIINLDWKIKIVGFCYIYINNVGSFCGIFRTKLAVLYVKSAHLLHYSTKDTENFAGKLPKP